MASARNASVGSLGSRPRSRASLGAGAGSAPPSAAPPAPQPPSSASGTAPHHLHGMPHHSYHHSHSYPHGGPAQPAASAPMTAGSHALSRSGSTAGGAGAGPAPPTANGAAPPPPLQVGGPAHPPGPLVLSILASGRDRNQRAEAAVHHPSAESLIAYARAAEATWIQFGQIAESLGDLERALFSYESALRHNACSVPALSQVAAIFRHKEDFVQAAECFSRVLALVPDNGDVWGALGHCYLMMDDLKRAYESYQQAIWYVANPQEPKLWYGIGILYDRYGSLEQAEQAFANVIKMDPSFEKANEVYFRLGIIYKQQRKSAESLECFRHVLPSPPYPLLETDILFQIGHTYEQSHEYDQARETYEQVLAANSTHAKVLQQLGGLYQWTQTSFRDAETAIELLTRSLESDASDAFSWYLLGRAYMSTQNFSKAYESYQQAVYRDGKNPAFWCSIGVLYYSISQFHDALDAYSRAIRIHPYLSEVWFNLGALYEACNDQLTDAVDAYQRTLQLDPSNSFVSKRLRQIQEHRDNGGPPPSAPPSPRDISPTSSFWSSSTDGELKTHASPALSAGELAPRAGGDPARKRHPRSVSPVDNARRRSSGNSLASRDHLQPQQHVSPRSQHHRNTHSLPNALQSVKGGVEQQRAPSPRSHARAPQHASSRKMAQSPPMPGDGPAAHGAPYEHPEYAQQQHHPYYQQHPQPPPPPGSYPVPHGSAPGPLPPPPGYPSRAPPHPSEMHEWDRQWYEHARAHGVTRPGSPPRHGAPPRPDAPPYYSQPYPHPYDRRYPSYPPHQGGPPPGAYPPYYAEPPTSSGGLPRPPPHSSGGPPSYPMDPSRPTSSSAHSVPAFAHGSRPATREGAYPGGPPPQHSLPPPPPPDVQKRLSEPSVAAPMPAPVAKAPRARAKKDTAAAALQPIASPSSTASTSPTAAKPRRKRTAAAANTASSAGDETEDSITGGAKDKRRRKQPAAGTPAKGGARKGRGASVPDTASVASSQATEATVHDGHSASVPAPRSMEEDYDDEGVDALMGLAASGNRTPMPAYSNAPLTNGHAAIVKRENADEPLVSRKRALSPTHEQFNGQPGAAAEDIEAPSAKRARSGENGGSVPRSPQLPQNGIAAHSPPTTSNHNGVNGTSSMPERSPKQSTKPGSPAAAPAASHAPSQASTASPAPAAAPMPAAVVAT